MRPVVITACTNRKRLPPHPRLMARTIAAGAPEAVCAEWLSRLADVAAPRTALSDLYCGRGFRDAEAAAAALGGPLLIVSAGLGLAPATAAAPSYSLTLTPDSPDCVLRRAQGPAAAWWSVLSRASPFTAETTDRGGPILAALSRPYLGMVAQTWATWPAARLARLRLFVKDPPADLPAALRAQWMPYDDRLDAIPGYAGTQHDFAQRALRHFAAHFAPTAGSAADHAAAVEAGLAPLARAPRPLRSRRTDEDLVRLILQEWDVVGGRSAAMLRRLRRDLDVACEQGRFRALFRRAAAQREGAAP